MNGVERIAAERQRQIEQEGYTPEHDAAHGNSALAFAAACYAAPQTIYVMSAYESTGSEPWGRVEWYEPWPKNWARPAPMDGDTMAIGRRLRELEKAGALIAAEIDRLLATEVD